jgi:hypothetical protein
MLRNSQANMRTGPSRVASGTICRRKPRRPLLKRSSTSPKVDRRQPRLAPRSDVPRPQGECWDVAAGARNTPETSAKLSGVRGDPTGKRTRHAAKRKSGTRPRPVPPVGGNTVPPAALTVTSTSSLRPPARRASAPIRSNCSPPAGRRVSKVRSGLRPAKGRSFWRPTPPSTPKWT